MTDAPPHAIEAEQLTKRYRRMAAGFRLRTLKSALLEGTLTRGLRPEEAIVALDSVSFTVGRGEAFGVIGANGSGKSTLLKLVAGLFKPTSGRLAVAGRVAALIELGAGFHPEISGRENVYINGAMLGLNRREIDQRYDRIVEFSGLEGFLEEPVKNYSSGMYVRLGFAVAVHTDPDVLLVDEVLSVGDEEFAHRCLRRIQEHLVSGGTLLVVSHSLDLVESLCDRVLWLDRGRSRGIGEPRRMIDAYRQQVAAAEGEKHLAEKDARAAEAAAGELAEGVTVGGEPADGEAEVLRWGSRQAEIVGFRLLVDGAERYELESGAEVTIEVEVVAREVLEDFVFGVAISTPRGIECWGTNTDLGGFVSQRLEGKARASVGCRSLRLAAGEYEVDLAVHSRNGSPYDYRRRCFRFTVTSRSGDRGVGVYAPEHRWTFAGGARLKAPTPPGTASG